MKRSMLFFLAITTTLTAVVFVGASQAQRAPEPSFRENINSLKCGSHPVLTTIFELAQGEAASSNPDDALDALLSYYPHLKAQRSNFHKHADNDGSVEFDYINGGAKKMLVIAEKMTDDQWGTRAVALCADIAKGAK